VGTNFVSMTFGSTNFVIKNFVNFVIANFVLWTSASHLRLQFYLLEFAWSAS